MLRGVKFPPTYTSNPTIEKLLRDLDVLKTSYEFHPVEKEKEILLRRKALLKSSLFSAKIEGNTLDMEDIDTVSHGQNDREKSEVSNLVIAYERLPQWMHMPVDVQLIQEIHRLVMQRISSGAGYFRTDESAIFNQAGVAVYLTPAPAKIRQLLTSCVGYIQTSQDPDLIIVSICHVWFEKIHPFIDGNGRVGRLLSSLLLQKFGYSFGGIVSFEEYLEKHRDRYYRALERDAQDVSEFIEFYLEALADQVRASLTAAYSVSDTDPYVHLLPRRAEIMRIIEDHKIVSFDFLSRRFRAVPVRTLHYDIAQLMKAGFIQKRGATRGAQYMRKL